MAVMDSPSPRVESGSGIEVCLVLGLRLTRLPFPVPVSRERPLVVRDCTGIATDEEGIPFDDTVEKEDTDLPRPLPPVLPRLFLPREWVEETDDARELEADAEPEVDAVAVDRVPSRNRRLGGRSISANVGLGADTPLPLPLLLPDDRE